MTVFIRFLSCIVNIIGEMICCNIDILFCRKANFFDRYSSRRLTVCNGWTR